MRPQITDPLASGLGRPVHAPSFGRAAHWHNGEKSMTCFGTNVPATCIGKVGDAGCSSARIGGLLLGIWVINALLRRGDQVVPARRANGALGALPSKPKRFRLVTHKMIRV